MLHIPFSQECFTRTVTCTLSVEEKKKKRIRRYPAPGVGLFQREVATLRRSTGIAFGAAMGRLLAVDVVNHMMRQRYNALVMGSDLHGN